MTSVTGQSHRDSLGGRYYLLAKKIKGRADQHLEIITTIYSKITRPLGFETHKCVSLINDYFERHNTVLSLLH